MVMFTLCAIYITYTRMNNELMGAIEFNMAHKVRF